MDPVDTLSSRLPADLNLDWKSRASAFGVWGLLMLFWLAYGSLQPGLGFWRWLVPSLQSTSRSIDFCPARMCIVRGGGSFIALFLFLLQQLELWFSLDRAFSLKKILKSIFSRSSIDY